MPGYIRRHNTLDYESQETSKMITCYRLKYFRKRRNLTQKELGMMIGFSESSADVRIAQYELGSENPEKS